MYQTTVYQRTCLTYKISCKQLIENAPSQHLCLATRLSKLQRLSYSSLRMPYLQVALEVRLLKCRLARADRWREIFLKRAGDRAQMTGKHASKLRLFVGVMVQILSGPNSLKYSMQNKRVNKKHCTIASKVSVPPPPKVSVSPKDYVQLNCSIL